MIKTSPLSGAAWRLPALSLCATLLVACGGGGGSAGSSTGPSPTPAPPPPTRQEAARFLTQATFGPTEAQIQEVMSKGYAKWIDDQLALPATSHRAYWDAADAAIKAADATKSAGQGEVLQSFWKQAIGGNDQLRQRMSYALSQVMVISMQDNSVGDNPRGVAGYMDMLGDKGLGNYRDLLQGVSTHPMMGYYLTFLRNQKEDLASGRVPDQNYAREVMQLFSVGLVKLNPDGTVFKDAQGNSVETYTASDIAGLSKVFTGWSYAGPDATSTRFYGGGTQDVDRMWKPMQAYPQFHSISEKTFLNFTIPAQTTADPAKSLQQALDVLAGHDNVPPFICRQLIQRFVTSNPSPAYVNRVAAVFRDNGSGTRGDMKAVLKAILLDTEARSSANLGSSGAALQFGKVREPVLKLSAVLRAFAATSDSGAYLVGVTDDPATSLSQTPMRSPSVFNFYRPGYAAPGSTSGTAGLVAPELQIMHETSTAGYVNYMRDAVSAGVGARGLDGKASRRDLQMDYTPALAVADQPAQLVELVNQRLLYGQMSTGLRSELTTLMDKLPIPAATGSNQTAIDTAKKNRAMAVIWLTAISPEFQVQR